MNLAGRRILLVIGGGIAAYKALELIRALRSAGAGVVPVLTAAACRFIAPLSAAALAGTKAHTDLFDADAEAAMDHIALSRSADLILICPASADLLARMAAGMADDLATTLLLATDKPVVAAPAMNVRMWLHGATLANVAVLRRRGIHIVEPEAGQMACGEVGAGRLAALDSIVEAVTAALAPGALRGRHIVLTAGPTHEPIDPVRYIANRSSGRQGYAIAAALAALGARVTLISGPVALDTPAGVQRIDVETAAEMAAAVQSALPADAAVMVAAVADWALAEPLAIKMKKQGGAPPVLRLKENPDILAMVARPGPMRPAVVVGFAAETHDVLAHGRAKLASKGADMIIANDVSGDVMGGTHNAVHLITSGGEEYLAHADKGVIARGIAARIATMLEGIAS